MATAPTRGVLDRDFQLLVAAAIAGERCPQNTPHGPLHDGSISALVEEGRIRSEVYALNFRRVTILVGDHKGKSTANEPGGKAPYMVNGRHVDSGRYSGRARQAAPVSDVSLPKFSWDHGLRVREDGK
jgi:hypothetical protein